MTQGPWSVKGIDPRARSVARENAQRRGITLGQYLNTLLLDDGEDDGVEAMFEHRQPVEKIEEPDELQSITDEINQLSLRLEATQERSAKAITGVDRSILDLQGRVEESGRASADAVDRVTEALKEIGLTQNTLRERVQTLEADTESHATLSALHDLEASLARLARNVEERAKLDAKLENIDTIIAEAVQSSTEQVNSRVGQIDDRIAKVQDRMDSAIQRINEASNRFETFETRTERSVADTAKLMERALDANTTRSKAMSKELVQRVESIEGQTRNAVNSLGDAVSRIIDRLSTAEDTGESALRTIEESVTGIDDRFSRLEHETTNDIGRLENSFQKRLDILAESLAKPMQSVREDVEQQIEHALRSNQPEEVERLAATLEHVQERLDASEGRQADAIVSMSKEVERLSHAIDTRIKALEAGDGGVSIDGLREEVRDMTQRIEERLAFVETDRRMANGSVQDLRHQLESIDQSIDERIASVSAAHDQAVDERIARIAEENEQRIEARVADVAKSHSASLMKLGSTVANLGDQVESLAVADHSEEFSQLTEKIDERIRDSERRSADAITQIGEQVARVAERLQSQHADSLRSLESRLANSERSHKAKLNDAVTGMSQRLQEIGDETSTALQPFHKKVSSLAQRIADIEDANIAPRQREPQQTARLVLDLDEEESDIVELDDVDEPEERAIASADVVGTEPPPFDESTDDHLFGAEEGAPPRDEPPKAEKSNPRKQKSAPAANKIDDLLEIDDVVLQFDNPKDKPKPRPEFSAPLPDRKASFPEDADYISRAREAARSGNRTTIPAETAGRAKGVSKGPLMASAALAIAVAGGGAWSVIRGKQDDAASGDTFARQDPSAPFATASDPDATESVLFNAATATGVVEPETTDEPLFANSVIVPDLTSSAGNRAPTLAEAVAAGDPVALYDQAQELIQTGEKTRAVSMLKQAAADGLVLASYRLAKLHERGEGVPRDMAAARRWTEQAAIGGNVRAMHDLAVFYAEGDSGPQSYAAAVEWFRQASDLGLVDSQYNLAVLFEQGLGISEDRSEAAYWFEVAGRGGDEDSLRRARTLLAEMPTTLAEQIRRRARSYNPKRSDRAANGDLGVRAWEQPTPTQIAEIQRLLNRLGYSAGEPDGQPGARTVEAIRAFEASNGADPRGDPTLSLLRQLRVASPA